ncbi:MAG TPA: protein kinase [Polyangiaceae bacterium]|nr:protein kinase [Polyangiaceae bacterium]
MAPTDSVKTRTGTQPSDDGVSRDREIQREESERPRFAPGALVGNRFRIVRFLARGGMGEVFEAEDLELRTTVALKCLSDGKASTGEPLARLKREAALARRITHPNVCRVFDVGFHVDPVSGDAAAFLTMQLVEGETLKACVARQGAFSPRAAMPLVRDLCAGLSAAHAAGVIHRDFKTSNVILHRGAGPTSESAVITDFGLARLADDDASVTREGRWLGTPASIAPEQLLGDPLTPATDVYALGIVLFEMLTGTVPFVGDTPLATANMRLLRRAPAVRERKPEVPPHWDAVVARCLERRPARRYATPEQVLHALEHPTSGWRRPAVAVAGLLLVAGAGIGAWRLRSAPGSERTTLSLVASQHRPAVAIVAAPAGGSPDAQLDALAELVATELASSDRVRLVPQEMTARTIGDARPASSGLPATMLASLRSAAGADYVLALSLERPSDRGAKVRLRVYDASATQPEARVQLDVDGSADDMLGLASRTSTRVRDALGGAPLPPEALAQLRAALPKTLPAAEAYAEGLERKAHYDPSGARASFERAVAAESDFALGHLELSRTLVALGYDEPALAEAIRAEELSGPLGREERMVIAAQHAVAAKDWAKASETFRALFDFSPDNLDYGIYLTRSLVYVGKPSDAFATLDRLRGTPRTAVDDARIDSIESFIAAKSGDVRRRLSSSLEAKRKADALGAIWIAADARMSVAEAYRDLGQAEKGQADVAEARALYERLGDRSGLAGVCAQEADLAEARGDHDRALALMDSAVSLAREVGDRYRTAGKITWRALELAELGRLKDAQQGFDEARSLYEAIHDVEGIAHNIGNAAEMRVARGQLAGARNDFERALDLHRQIGMRLGIVEQTLNIGRAAYLEGDVQTSGRRIDEALAAARSAGDGFDSREAFAVRGDLLRARDDVAGARSAYDDAKKLADDAADIGSQLRAELAQARFALDEAGGPEVLERVRAIVARFTETKLPHMELLSRAVLVRALVLQGALAEAADEDAKLEASVGSCELFEARFEAQLARAELAQARGDAAAAMLAARGARDAAEQGGFVPLVLEARLVEARVAAPADRSALAERLVRDARAAGFLRVARLARVRR